MNLHVKKFIYLINDISNALLKKDRERMAEQVKNLRIALISVSILLLVSIIFNIILWLR